MPTYISLIRYTDQGIRNVKDSPSRLETARQAFRQAGGELKQWYLAFGEYDAVVIAEAPNDETAARLTLLLGSQGNVRTRTTRVFDEGEYRRIVSSLP